MATVNNIFPENAPQRIPLPVPDENSSHLLKGQIPSWRAISSSTDVQVIGSNVDTPDDQGFFPIFAVYVPSRAVRGHALPCVDATAFINDGLSRCSVCINRAEFVVPPGTAPTQQNLHWVIKGSLDGLSTTLLAGDTLIPVQPNQALPGLSVDSLVKGIIGSVSGVLVNQFEFWAVIDSEESRLPVRLRIQMIVDRLGTSIMSYLGTPSNGGGPIKPVDVES